MTMGIVGLGGIGSQIARRARAMDMNVIAVDIMPKYKEQIGDICDEVPRGSKTKDQESLTFRQKKPGGEPGAPKKIFRYMLDELSTNTYQIPCQRVRCGTQIVLFNLHE